MRIVLVTFSVAALAILPMTAARAESDIERAIANGIASNLKESGRLHGYKIGIKMKADTAWLVGQVSSAEQKEAALGIAQESTGVRRVIDKLTVVPRPEPSAAGAGRAGIMGRGRYDQAALPGYAWPSYAAYPNYAALTYPKQYSPTAWPYIGPFYPYPQVPLGWRKVSLEWDDGWWFLDFNDHKCNQR